MLTEILAKLRTAKKITQADLAKKLGIARTTYAGYENGSRKPDPDTLQKLADVFDVTVDYLLGRSDNPTSSHSTIPNNDFSDTEKQILEEMKKYPVFFNDLASNPSNLKKVMKMWVLMKDDINNDEDEED